MINHAMFPPDKDELNEFTRFIYLRNKPTMVKSRSGRIFEISKSDKNEDEDISFQAKDWGSFWYANGESAHSTDYDLVQTIGLANEIRSYRKLSCE